MSTRILTGDCRVLLATLPAKSVHCCVTSPPYWGLRDYGTAQWEGGDPACDHKQGRPGAGRADGIVDERAQRNRDGVGSMGGDCKCGAIRIDSQLGLEPTYGEYVANMVAVFREVRRVLRDDGTVWLNIGDSYSSGGRSYPQVAQTMKGPATPLDGSRRVPADILGIKPKDLVGIPWRVAFALQADGWYLRQDIIWSKPNPMPESVRDRCTKAHEYLFLLSKKPRYYFDAEAIAEPTNWPEGSWGRSKCYDGDQTGMLRSFYGNGAQWKGGDKRNKRSVWEIATQPFSEAHFATFPPALIEPCILAGCPVGGTVLDPFFGAGTTGLVADRLGRDCIGIELNPAYAAMATNRVYDDCPLFADVS